MGYYAINTAMERFSGDLMGSADMLSAVAWQDRNKEYSLV